MAWLHTWCGLTCGWLLCAIFLAGTLSVFRAPITLWMQAAPVLPASGARLGAQADAGVSNAALANALDYLGRHAASAKAWSLTLPDTAGEALMLSWRDAGGRAMQVAADPADGSALPVPWGRQTEGGRHFMSFHYMLHAGMAGFWLVGWIAMCALVALVSGIVVHKRIFKDFFTFRPGKGQRSWLDAHNAGAVLTLPFLLMIVYTGLSYFYSSYMPLPLRAVYGDAAGAYQSFQSELKEGEGAMASPLAAAVVTLPNIGPLRDRAEALTGDAVRRIFIARPGRPDMVVRMMGDKPDSADTGAIHGEAGLVVFEQAGPRIVEAVRSGAPEHFSARHVHPVLEQLHVAGFGGWGMKWLYFLSGLIGTAMIATGLQLFAIKRRQKSLHEFGRATPQVYRLIDILNLTFIAGACVASIGFFYANRLIPAQAPDRPALEIQAYFAVWLACLLHAALRPVARAWREQVALLAALCLGLPLLNWITTGQHLPGYLARQDWQRAGVELCALAIGAAALLVWRRLGRAPAAEGRTA
ncbi:PepSY-associated TM helix domain-containing protein [Herbaspirillum sp. LeCh32-8]|uniref:PepSY-associated TM helix domain-containing protein n=1 Tax=Herbaspirillum sp. LeCh32-8 TaxID=2821356 RepID=UPI001FD75C44|nr:PepSY-associated TM helix domain-containing protein [Herbaspirillum sp. LeCh32-8]